MEKSEIDGFKPVLTAGEIKKRVGELGARITEDYGNEYPLFIGVLKGAFVFLADLVRAISVPVEIDFAQISSYGDETQSSGRIKILRDISTPITDRHGQGQPKLMDWKGLLTCPPVPNMKAVGRTVLRISPTKD